MTDTYLDRHTLGAGELARFIAAVAPSLEPETRAQLRREAAATLAQPTAAELLEARLGLLGDVVLADPEWLPSTGEYDRERERRRREHGELWPQHETLIGLYHHWFTACEYARRRVQKRSHRRVPLGVDPGEGDDGDRDNSAPLTHDEAIQSLMRFRAKYGTWPVWWEVMTWYRLTKPGALGGRRTGFENPSTARLELLFGSVDDAVRRAKTRWRDIGRAD